MFVLVLFGLAQTEFDSGVCWHVFLSGFVLRDIEYPVVCLVLSKGSAGALGVMTPNGVGWLWVCFGLMLGLRLAVGFKVEVGWDGWIGGGGDTYPGIPLPTGVPLPAIWLGCAAVVLDRPGSS
jgi:hypothetical protein